MNRFMKWSVILGMILSLIGIGVITAGAMMGGGYYLEWALRKVVREGWNHGRRNIREAELYGFGTVPEEERSLEPGDSFCAPEGDFQVVEMDYPEDPFAPNELFPWEQLENGGIPVERTMVYDQVRELDLDVLGMVLLRESQDLAEGQVRIEICGDGEDYQYRQKGDKLEIRPSARMYENHAYDNLRQGCRMILSLPVGANLAEVEVNARAGAFWAHRLQASEISLRAEAGAVQAENIQTDELSLESDTGYIRCGGAVRKEVQAECNLGQIHLTLDGKKSDYSYEMECNLGKIFLGGEEPEEYEGVSWEKEILNPGGKNVKLECGVGCITVNFSEE